MATRTLTRMYDSYDDAAQVVRDLEAAGVPESEISIVSNDTRHRTTTAEKGGSGAGAGATVGTVVGGGLGLLAGIGALAIPGVGPVIAAGWLIATITGAGVGAAAGGLVGALTGSGVSEREANVYGEGVRRGGTLVTVRADEARSADIIRIMETRRPVNWEERESEYRQGGWTRYDESAGPWTEVTAARPASGDVSPAESERLRGSI